MNEYMRSIVESTEAIAKQRDEARAEVEKLKAERDHQQKRAEAIENAARGLLADLDNPEGSLTWSCRECPRVSTCQVDGSCYCDEHSPGGGWDTTYAPTIRALRALLEGKS